MFMGFVWRRQTQAAVVAKELNTSSMAVRGVKGQGSVTCVHMDDGISKISQEAALIAANAATSL